MSIMQRQTFHVLTDTGAESFTDTGPPVSGFIFGVDVVMADTGQLDTGATLTITNAQTGKVIAGHDNISTDSFSFIPKMNSTDTGGAVAGDGYIPMAGESLRVNVSAGGVAKRATVHVYVGY